VVPKPPPDRPPRLLIGGNGDRLLAVAAEVADIVSFTGFGPDREGSNVPTHFSRAGLADRVALVRRRSADRAAPPELNVLLQTLVITDDRQSMAREIAQQRGRSIVDVLTCPFLAFGPVEEICGQLTRLRDDLGIGYVTVFDHCADDAATVLAALIPPAT
jgi:alkanesulfonate monooxygenase SsuD/methylene tetrahydromethanopterin reductase-like flavin-dependent oxidoreductase (luciferase family)